MGAEFLEVSIKEDGSGAGGCARPFYRVLPSCTAPFSLHL